MKPRDYRHPARRAGLEALRAYATPRELAYVDAVIEHGNARAAAAVLGVHHSAVAHGIQRAERRAKLYEDTPRGPAGKLHNTPPVSLAEGQELKRQTIHVDAGGVLLDRYDLTQAVRNPPAFEVVPAGHHVTKTTTRLDADGRVGMQYVTAKHEAAAREQAFWDACRTNAREYKGISLPARAPKSTERKLLSCYPIGDPHIGMLAHAAETGRNFDLKIAEAELVECMRQLFARTPASHHALIIQLGDFYHAQDNTQTTPGHGHKLDVDGRTFKVQATGQRILRSVVDLALRRHKRVTFVSLPGNHDPNMSFGIASWVAAVYERDRRLTVDPSIAPYYFKQFGVNLIGATHGDGAKEAALPLLMATRQREAWGTSKYCVMHAGHIHHTRLVEHSGCRTWYHNTLADKDAWHTGKGYDSEQCLTSITYHEDYGQEGTQTMGIERVREALARKAA
jgi:hypothetical protein